MFPNIVIPPQGFILVFASGHDTTGTQNLHANFKLKSNGESILLSNPNSILLNQLSLVALNDDRSFGRIPDGSSQLSIFYSTSPNSSNNENSELNKLTVSQEAGFYNASVDLQIISTKPKNIIHFTLDGSIPTIDSPILGEIIRITSRVIESYEIAGIPT